MIATAVLNKDPDSEISIYNNDLNCFLVEWDNHYKNILKEIPLFNPRLTATFSQNKKIHFVKLFYHARGHFHDFLWHMGNYAPSTEYKKIILANITEEFGKNGLSHEQLYIRFATSLNINLSDEILHKKNYLDFLQDFNKNHLQWLMISDWKSKFSAFAAYERLDNIDYFHLYNLAKSFGLEKKDITFFSVHLHAKHFDETEKELDNMWKLSPQKIIDSFNFIAENQLHMWKKISETIIAHN